MKAAWTRLANIILKQDGHTKFMEPRFDVMFLKHHKNASEIVVNKQGKPLAAIYFTPTGMHQTEFKSLIRNVRDSMQYASDEGTV
jgi:hypothetical protein